MRYAIVAALLLLGACRGQTAAVPSVVAPARHVVLVSLDGFRWDYIERAPAINLRALAARGVRADRLLPVFPSKTFPNHYSIVTGLTAEQHGIIANSMRDPVLGTFTIRDTIAQGESRWWGGEPIWVTAERQGRRAASVSWPGSEAAIKGYRPTWWARYWHEEPAAAKTEKVLGWLSLPPDSAPAVITLYFHDVDTEGHRYGPDAPQTDSAIARVDRAIGELVSGIARLGKTDEVALIVVSDHGMSQTGPERVIVLDDYLDPATLDIVDGNPVAMLGARDGDHERAYRALAGRHPHLQVYRKGELPARWHFNDNARITPIVAVADDGWTIATRAQLERWRSQNWQWGGTHGYDPALPAMGALFVAAGPGLARGKTVPPLRNGHVYALMTHLLGLTPAPTAGSVDSVRALLR